MNIRSLSKLFFYLPACLLHFFPAQAQDKTVTQSDRDAAQPYIMWVSQYPAVKEKETRESTVKKIYEFLVQKNKKAALVRPVAILASSPLNFWVLDQGGETVFQVQKDKMVTPHSIRKKDNYFSSLIDVCSMANGDILFTDSRLNKIFILNHHDKSLSVFNDSLVLQQPTGIAYSTITDEIWVVETGAHRVCLLSSKGVVIKRIGIRGDENGQFNYPTSIWIDKSGDAYVVDAMNFRIEIFNKNGAFVSTFGQAGDASGNFARPKGIATDSYGNIYVADALFHVVQIFDRNGKFLYSFGKQGREKEEFWMPSGIYVDSKNYIYVADSYNSRVQVFQLINGS